VASSPSIADPVFKWTTPDGRIHYGSKPPQPGSKPALLPKIIKADIPLSDRYADNCDNHGGVACAKGKDPADGSVICADGYQDAAQLFTRVCSKDKNTH
jgi:Domain of unknown function (DUF4124)